MVKEVFKVKVLTFDYFTFIADIKCREIDGFDAQVGTCHTTNINFLWRIPDCLYKKSVTSLGSSRLHQLLG